MDSGSRHTLACCLNIIVILLSLFGSRCHSSSPSNTTDDPHGGVPMGIRNKACDNGKDSTSIDWDPSDTDVHTCLGSRRSPAVEYKHFKTCEETAKRPVHVCYPEVIPYTEDIPTSGRHRPLWPVYGEYTYLPVQRWLHSLEHGSIVFLYHPCADQTQIDNFKAIAESCLRRHIISPYKKMPPGINFAVVSWKCKQLFSYPSVPAIVQFVRAHAFKSPEWDVYDDGQYDIGLIKKAAVVSDMKDSKLCDNVMDSFETSLEKLNKKSKNRKNQYGEQLKHYPRIPV